MNWIISTIVAAGAFLMLILSRSLIENVDADEILILQHPTNGTLT